MWYCFPNWPRNLANSSASSASEARLADTKAAATRRSFMLTDTSWERSAQVSTLRFISSISNITLILSSDLSCHACTEKVWDNLLQRSSIFTNYMRWGEFLGLGPDVTMEQLEQVLCFIGLMTYLLLLRDSYCSLLFLYPVSVLGRKKVFFLSGWSFTPHT